VSPAGELLGEPAVIRSTGYLGLNQQAIAYIEALDFSTVESFTGYQFEVLVTYEPENCVEVGNRAPANVGTGAATGDGRDTTEDAKTVETEKPRSRSTTDQNESSPDSDDGNRETLDASPEDTTTSTSDE
jgi:hypothetical protein